FLAIFWLFFHQIWIRIERDMPERKNQRLRVANFQLILCLTMNRYRHGNICLKGNIFGLSSEIFSELFEIASVMLLFGLVLVIRESRVTNTRPNRLVSKNCHNRMSVHTLVYRT